MIQGQGQLAGRHAVNMLTALQRSGGIDALARQAGVEPPQAHSFARSVLPAMLQALRNMPGGRAAVLAELDRQGGTALAAAVMAVEPVDASAGQAILAGALGAERASLGDIAAQAGGAPERLLPLLVMLVGGYVSAMAAGHGAGPEGLDALLGEAA